MLSISSFVRVRPVAAAAAAKHASVLAVRSLSSTAGTNYDVVVIGKTTQSTTKYMNCI